MWSEDETGETGPIQRSQDEVVESDPDKLKDITLFWHERRVEPHEFRILEMRKKSWGSKYIVVEFEDDPSDAMHPNAWERDDDPGTFDLDAGSTG